MFYRVTVTANKRVTTYVTRSRTFLSAYLRNVPLTDTLLDIVTDTGMVPYVYLNR